MLSGITIFALLCFFAASVGNGEETKAENPQIAHPEWYIKVTEWSILNARGVAVIHHVMIENTGDVTYKNPRVLVRYYSNEYGSNGVQVAVERGVLPVTLPPRSKKVYLKGGATLGAITGNVDARELEVLGAVVVQ